MAGWFGIVPAAEAATVYAKDYGFNAADATAAVQNAIDTGASQVIISNMGTDWILKPIMLRSNLTLTLEPGVRIQAKRGEFHGTNDCLFTAYLATNLTIQGNGAVLAMHREDYTNPALYTYSQWRHVIYLLSSSNVTIQDLTARDSGGDGIFIGSTSGRAPCTSVLVKNVNCDNNYRQGISVTNANGCIIQDSIMQNTNGQEPQAGIDFEPDDATMQLVNCVVRNCRFVNNAKAGILVYPQQLDGTPNISIDFYGCTVTSAAGWGVQVSPIFTTGPAGYVDFHGCLFEDIQGPALYMPGKGAYRAGVLFDGCVFRRTAKAAINGFPAIPFVITGDNPTLAPEYGGLQFTNTLVVDTVNRVFLQALEPVTSLGCTNLQGAVTVQNPYGARMSLGAKAHNIGLQILTALPTVTKTRTAIPTLMRTLTRTATRTPTPTATRTPTRTATRTRTAVFTASRTATVAKTRTPTATSTRTEGITATRTRTPVVPLTRTSTPTLAARTATSVPSPATPTVTFTPVVGAGIVYAKDFGFTALDATTALQSAINSGARTVVVSNMGTDWLVRPITLAGEQELVFETGVVVRAQAGQFHGVSDSLFTADHKNNVVIRGNGAVWKMRRGDYITAAYTPSQTRHVLAILSSSNVSIRDLTLRDGGGDGIYIGALANQPPCQAIYGKNLVCDNNYRDGFRVASADNLLVEDSWFQNSIGAGSQAGLNLEPSLSGQSIARLGFNNCRMVNNAKAAVQIYPQALTASSPAVSVTLANCTLTSNLGWGVQFGPVWGAGSATGYIQFTGCTITDVRGPGLYMNSKAAYQLPVYFRQCVWRRVAQESFNGFPAIPFCLTGDFSAQTPEYGGVEFTDARLEDSFDRFFLTTFEPESSAGLAGLRGTLTVANNYGARMNPGAKAHDITLLVNSEAGASGAAGGAFQALNASDAPTMAPTPELAAAQVFAYPNPTRGKLSFRFAADRSGEAEIRLLNMAGELVYRQTAEVGASGRVAVCDVRFLAPGIYLFQVECGGRRDQGKFSVIR